MKAWKPSWEWTTTNHNQLPLSTHTINTMQNNAIIEGLIHISKQLEQIGRPKQLVQLKEKDWTK